MAISGLRLLQLRTGDENLFIDSGGRINSQHFYKFGNLSEMAEGIARGFVIAAKEVHVEDILPRSPPHGPRLNLTQTDVAQGKHAQRFKQCSGSVLHFEGNGSLVVSTRGPKLSPLLASGCHAFAAAFLNQKETGE